MLNISFTQIIILLLIVFLLFGDVSKFKLNLKKFKEFLQSYKKSN